MNVRRIGVNRFWPTFPVGIYETRQGWLGVTTVTPTPMVPIAGAPGAGGPVAGAPPQIQGGPPIPGQPLG